MNRLILSLILLGIWGHTISQLTIRTSVPVTTPGSTSIFLAGTMNNWNPGHPSYKMTKDSAGIYSITFTPAVGTVKFKFTRGSWDTVEGTAAGTFIPDRSVVYSGQPKTIDLSIAGWEGNLNTSTASPQVRILSDTFYIPTLQKKRRIWLYLPKGYENSSISYPVLYMHDGQNLFDAATSFAGEWKIDESLDSLQALGDRGCIVVGIDNGGGERLNEYSPWINNQYGGGKGDEYVDFIVQYLKPYIDTQYRVLTDKDNTGIAGSSMGGLISMYAGIAYPDVFGRVGALSSAFWFSGEAYSQVSATGVKSSSYFYMLSGAQEGGNQAGDMEKMVTTLLSSGAATGQVYSKTHSDGKHSEWYWAREFPSMYKWLFEKKTSQINEPLSRTKVFVKCYNGHLVVSGTDLKTGVDLTVWSLSGHKLAELTTDHEGKTNLSGYEYLQGLYLVSLKAGSEMFTELLYIK